MAFFTALQVAYFFGILGNIVSFMVFLAPLPTFYRIYRMKSTQGFQSIPYSVSLFSAMIYLYYAYLKKKNALLLITVNSVGTVVETTYLIIFMIYATKTAKVFTTKLVLLFNLGGLGTIVICTYLFTHGQTRVQAVGWVCAVFSLSVFAAPLSIMRKVIKTKSVEFMPFSLSFFLTLCAIMWFFYGFLIKDYYIATPNVLGFSFGVAQMILYAIYKDGKKQVLPIANLKDAAAAAAPNHKIELTAVIDNGAVAETEAITIAAAPNHKIELTAVIDNEAVAETEATAISAPNITTQSTKADV